MGGRRPPGGHNLKTTVGQGGPSSLQQLSSGWNAVLLYLRCLIVLENVLKYCTTGFGSVTTLLLRGHNYVAAPLSWNCALFMWLSTRELGLSKGHKQNVLSQNKMPHGTKRPKTSQTVPWDKTSQGAKRPKGQNVPRGKTSHGAKGPKGQNVLQFKINTYYQVFIYTFCLHVLEIGPHNGPHPCTQFMIWLFIFWGG